MIFSRRVRSASSLAARPSPPCAASEASAASSTSSSIRHDPAAFAPVLGVRTSRPRSSGNSKACVQKCSCRMSLSHVRRSYHEVHPPHRREEGRGGFDRRRTRPSRPTGVAAALDRVVRRTARASRPGLSAQVPDADPCVEVPAVVVETVGVGDTPAPRRGLCASSARKPTATSATCTPVSSM